MSSDTRSDPKASPSPIPEGVREFLDVFRNELGEVAFPDLDRARLESRLETVRDRQQRLDAARAQVDEATRALEQAVAALTADARRGLAYARIYAEEKPDLAAKLSELKLDKRRKTSKKPPPRHKAKTRLQVATGTQASG